MATIITLPTSREIARKAAQRQVEPQPAPFAPTTAERFNLRAWADGYAIYDRGQLITTIHGPQYALAAKRLRLLRADDETPPEPPQAA